MRGVELDSCGYRLPPVGWFRSTGTSTDADRRCLNLLIAAADALAEHLETFSVPIEQRNAAAVLDVASGFISQAALAVATSPSLSSPEVFLRFRLGVWKLAEFALSLPDAERKQAHHWLSALGPDRPYPEDCADKSDLGVPQTDNRE